MSAAPSTCFVFLKPPRHSWGWVGSRLRTALPHIRLHSWGQVAGSPRDVCSHREPEGHTESSRTVGIPRPAAAGLGMRQGQVNGLHPPTALIMAFPAPNKNNLTFNSPKMQLWRQRAALLSAAGPSAGTQVDSEAKGPRCGGSPLPHVGERGAGDRGAAGKLLKCGSCRVW